MPRREDDHPTVLAFGLQTAEFRAVAFLLLTIGYLVLAALFPQGAWASVFWSTGLVTKLALFAAWVFIIRQLAAGGKSRERPNLSGKISVVTGANTGIGKETARLLAQMGSKVIVACRDTKKGDNAIKYIKDAVSGADVECMQMDLSDLSSVKQFAEQFIARHKRLDYLVNNAGVMMCPYSKTTDGFEMQFGTNHVGHFLLTKLLLPVINRKSGRVVNVSSFGHWFAKRGIEYDNIQNPNPYDPTVFYGYSKLANVLFTREMQRRLDSEGSGITAYSLHPGGVATELTRHVVTSVLAPLWFVVQLLLLKTPTEGAQTSIHCVVSDNLVPGGFYSDCVHSVSSGQARDMDRARELWERSEKLVSDFC